MWNWSQSNQHQFCGGTMSWLVIYSTDTFCFKCCDGCETATPIVGLIVWFNYGQFKLECAQNSPWSLFRYRWHPPDTRYWATEPKRIPVIQKAIEKKANIYFILTQTKNMLKLLTVAVGLNSQHLLHQTLFIIFTMRKHCIFHCITQGIFDLQTILTLTFL